MSLLTSLRKLRHGPLRRAEAVWRPLGQLYRGTVAALPVDVTTQQSIGGYGPFRLSAHFAFSDFHHWGADHNNGFRALIEACRGADCVFDVGAHIGLVCLPASRLVTPGGRIYAFEPANANLRYLRSHLRANAIGNVEVVPTLVGAFDAEEIAFFEQAGPTGMNSVVRPRSGGDYRTVSRRQVSLDRFCADRGLRPAVVKIDVEGAECSVIEGAREMLRTVRPKVFLSVHPGHLAVLGQDESRLMELAASVGYVIEELDGSPVRTFRLAEYLMRPLDT